MAVAAVLATGGPVWAADAPPVAAPTATASETPSPVPPTFPALTKSTHLARVPSYGVFRYQTATTRGLPAEAAANADRAIAALVDRTVREARQASFPCYGHARFCGDFEQRLTATRCGTAICLLQDVTLFAPSAAHPNVWTDTLVLDASTGAIQPIGQYVTPDRTAAFLAAVNAGIARQARQAGMPTTGIWRPHLTMREIRDWVPSEEGLVVFFGNGEATATAVGPVVVTVPWATLGSSGLPSA